MLAKYMLNLLNSVGFKDAWLHLQLLSLTIQNDAIAQLSHSTKMDTSCSWGVVVQFLKSECIASDYDKAMMVHPHALHFTKIFTEM